MDKLLKGKKTIRSVKTSDAKLFLIKYSRKMEKATVPFIPSEECCDQPLDGGR